MEVLVLSHYEVHDGSQPLYNKYFFEIQVRPEPNVVYRVDRSYVDFVELDYRIKRRLPGATVPLLPLSAANHIEKCLNVSTSKGWNPFKNVDEQQKEFPLQIVSGKNEQVQVVPLITPGSSSSAQIEPELILSKVQPLSAYLNKLLKFHEIVASDEFLLFLDEEAKDMKSNVKNLEALSIHDILLMRVSYNKCTVRKSEEASFKVLKGQIVVWQFSTEGYDIGFSVSVNGQTKISLTRYNSHQKVASGSLEVTEDGKVTLCWDNSHARLRSKKLAWVAKVLSQEDYNNAKVQALEIQREKRKFETQRHSLQRAALAMAASMSGIIHSSSVVHEHAKEDLIKIEELENEIKKAKKEVELLQADLDKAQEELDDIEKEKISVEQSRDQMTESWRYTVSQLEQLKQEFDIKEKDFNKYKESKNQELDKLRLMKDEEIKSSALGQSKERADLRLECDRLRVEADKYKSDYTNLKAKVYQLEDSVESEIKAKLFEEKVKLEYEEKCRGYEDDIRALNKRVSELEDTIRINDKQFLDFQADSNAAMEQEKIAHANTKAITDKVVADCRGDVANAIEREKLTALRVESLEKEKMELKISVETLKYEQAKEIDQIKSDAAKQIDKMKTESFAAVQSSNTTLETVMLSIQQMKQDKEKEAHFKSNAMHNETIRELQEHVRTLEDQISRFHEAKEMLQQSLNVPMKPPKRASVVTSPSNEPPSPMTSP